MLGEKKILELSKINDKFYYYIIRTSKLFGPLGKSKGVKKSFFDIMQNLSKYKKEIKVVDGETSCFTYTKDLAQATYKLVNDKTDKGIYHINNSSKCTWYEATKFLFNITKKKIRIIPISPNEFLSSAKRPEYAVLLNTKLKPLRSWKTALKEYLKV
ncbi:MAG: sugar nucleotide-binding protein [Xanthomonadaceae bacterium]|nr:sugar nucleotide-binding protein [Rhodospirillaceae bacterium]NIA18216.1 sugar nucleotide-binding protein [Xanthomonadaceae bacterium]